MGENELVELIRSGTCKLTRLSTWKDEGSEGKCRASRGRVGRSLPEPSLDSGEEIMGDGGDVYGMLKRFVGAVSESLILFAE